MSRTVEKRPVTHDREYTTSVTCDRCGVELWRPYLTSKTTSTWWEGGGEKEGGEVLMSAGYGSTHDLDHHEFDICDDCWPKLLRWFKASNQEGEPRS